MRVEVIAVPANPVAQPFEGTPLQKRAPAPRRSKF